MSVGVGALAEVRVPLVVGGGGVPRVVYHAEVGFPQGEMGFPVGHELLLTTPEGVETASGLAGTTAPMHEVVAAIRALEETVPSTATPGADDAVLSIRVAPGDPPTTWSAPRGVEPDALRAVFELLGVRPSA